MPRLEPEVESEKSQRRSGRPRHGGVGGQVVGGIHESVEVGGAEEEGARDEGEQYGEVRG